MNVGEQITTRLRAFNDWRDDFLIEASTLFLLLGFVMGTIDIYVRAGIATTTWFTWAWAIVQAISIDGLFFGVWGKIAGSSWTRATAKYNVPMLIVGLMLAGVAAIVNDILSYQQLNRISDSLIAMTGLHIDTTWFIHSRGVLVVMVAILVQLFCRHRPEDTSKKFTESKPKLDPIPEPHIDSIEETKPKLLALPEPKPTGHKEAIKSTIEKFIADGRSYTYQDIAKAIPCSIQTVKVHAPKIKAQIAKEA